MSNNFLAQINEDIQNIKKIWIDQDSKLSSDWYAFNYWVLNYLYHIDIENIADCITEYNDKGIDCFVHFEDEKELYIIQNFYYTEQSSIKRESISDFLISPLHYLSNNSYSRSKVLQDIYNTIKNDKDYNVYLYCYTTKAKNSISKDILSLFDSQSFNYTFNVFTKLIDIKEIKNIYEGNRFDNIISFECNIKIKRDDIIEQNSEQHDKENNVDTAYVAINVYEIYNVLKASQEAGYDLFDKNIREYLGIKGKRGKTNKEIQATLLDDTERNRFFYYNNGITIICDNFVRTKSNNKWTLQLKQPQIVNGCQTVNTIFNTIDNLLCDKEVGEVVKDFRHCSILVKIFKVNKTNDAEKEIYENIVRYTNTQTGITAKDFASKDDYFINLQQDFLKRGFYLIVKQSDKHKFELNDIMFQNMKLLSSDRINFFGKTVTKPNDLFIDLDRMLKALLAFYFDGYTAYKSGASALRENSDKYYAKFSKKIRDYFSTDNMINLFLLFEKTGGTTTGRKIRYPIPYYMMDFIGRFIKFSDLNEYDPERVNSKLNYLFDNKATFEEIYNKFCEINTDYCDEFMELYNVDYSTMIKGRKIDNELLLRYIKQKKKDAERNNWNNFLEYLS